jgi:hypothetical protein
VTSDDGSTSKSYIPKLEDALKKLSNRAMEVGFSATEISLWLKSDNTLIRLIEKEIWWLEEIPEGTGSDAVALHFVKMGRSIARVPAHLKSYRVCLEATSGPHSSPSNLMNVPPEHRRAELLHAAVSKNPYAIDHLQRNERTIELYEFVASKVDLDTFSSLNASQEMRANARYRKAVKELRELENSPTLLASRIDPYDWSHSSERHCAELTLGMYKFFGAKVDLGTLSRRYISQEMAERPRFKAVLERLRRDALPGLNHGGAPIQGGGGGGGGGGGRSSS